MLSFPFFDLIYIRVFIAFKGARDRERGGERDCDFGRDYMGEREMDFRGSRHKGKGKAKESIVLCDCGLPAKKAQSWTDENPFRRFYG